MKTFGISQYSTTMSNKKIVLASFMAQAGVASRRRCQTLIQNGEVRVNGTISRELTTFVSPKDDEVSYRNRRLEIAKPKYLLLHKPRGYTCSASDKHASKLALDLLPQNPGERLFSVGRLDKDSEGLLIFTNDGTLAQHLTHPSFEVTKTYHVDVFGQIKRTDLLALKSGISDAGDLLKAVSARVLKSNHVGATLEIIVKEGKKREIRRMCKHLKYRVSRLRRVAVGSLRLGAFKPGFSRELTAKEVRALKFD